VYEHEMFLKDVCYRSTSFSTSAKDTQVSDWFALLRKRKMLI